MDEVASRSRGRRLCAYRSKYGERLARLDASEFGEEASFIDERDNLWMIENPLEPPVLEGEVKEVREDAATVKLLESGD